MCRILLLLEIVMLAFASQAMAQSDTLLTRCHTLMFWNVENAFWPDNDPRYQDDDFTPEGIHRWTRSRLRQKLTLLNRVIMAAGGGKAPMVIGLAEVEGDSVMRYWTHSTSLWDEGYRYVVCDSADVRGIHTALLYQPSEFHLVSHASHSIMMPNNHHATRQLLHAAGRLASGDTLDLIVCHLPSQLGGSRQSQDARDVAHRVLMQLADSITRSRNHPQVVIMGDMNEAPLSRHAWWQDAGKSYEKRQGSNRSKEPTKIKCKESGNSNNHNSWNNLMLPLQQALTRHPGQYGSHKYQGQWSFLDQFIVNEELLPYIRHASSFSLPFMLTADESNLGHRPRRAYYGAQYEGGPSDHLPIIVELLFTF